jgi:hypothetical protein
MAADRGKLSEQAEEPYRVSDERLAEIRGLLRPASGQSSWQTLPMPGVTVYDLAAAVEDLLAEREGSSYVV